MLYVVFQICENGIVTFKGAYIGSAVPTTSKETDYFYSRVVVAPYFADIDLNMGGSIYYRLYSEDQITADESVNDAIMSILNDAGYGAMEKFMLLVVTWENVVEYNQPSNLVSSNV